MANPRRPNILFIVADDLGHADLGCYGGRDAPFGPVSPVLDHLAANGLRFTQGYANSPVCSPTRFGLMTARYQYRLRGAAEEPIASRSRGSTTLGLPPSHPTLPSLLRDVGYRTALIGKWHLGSAPHFGPLKSGYDMFFGAMSGGVDYFTHCDSTGRHDLWQDEAEHTEHGYLTDLLSTRCAAFVETALARGEPFFASLHYTAPHWPWETRDDAGRAPAIKDQLFDLAGGNIHVYQRMVHHMDEGIGHVIDVLAAHGALADTLIVFTSDNGGERFSDTWPLVGGKMDLTEGGIRVPYIVHWPAVVAQGGVSAQPCMTMDWSATMLGVGGATPHPDYPLDGISLRRVLEDPSHAFDRPLFWRMKHRDQRALRDGRWKYLKVDAHEYLFDIDYDARERANLGGRDPEQLAAMRDRWIAWDATMPAIPSDATVTLGYSRADMPDR